MALESTAVLEYSQRIYIDTCVPKMHKTIISPHLPCEDVLWL